MTHYLAFEAEQFLIPPNEWGEHLSHLADEGREILAQEMERPSGPTGLAKHPKYGYIILGAGLGPFIIWSEKELPS